MHAISLWQPWASALVAGIKPDETRHWLLPPPQKLSHRVAIHAAKKLVNEVTAELDAIISKHFGKNWRETLPRGALIGSVSFGRCLPCDAVLRAKRPREHLALGDYADGRFAWEAHLPEKWTPAPYSGRQGFFLLPHGVASRAAAGLPLEDKAA